MTELLRIEVPLAPLAAPAPRAALLGRGAHALLLRLMATVDPALATALHDALAPKAISAAVLPAADERVVLCFSALTAAVADALRAAVARLPSEIALGPSTWRVAGQPAEHGTTYAALTERLLFARRAPAEVQLRFVTPTTFRSEGRAIPLPLPGLVFGSLAERWNAYAPAGVPAELRSVVEQQVVVARYRLQTAAVSLAGGTHIGFTGTCSYRVVPPDPYWARVCWLLGVYAAWAGVGAKTALGLGQARCRPQPEELEGDAGSVRDRAGRRAAQER
jgi:CRISPR-associated endoribonuclease Cas6